MSEAKRRGSREKIEYKFFIGDREISELTEQEREAFADRAAASMGEAIQSSFAEHPEEYQKI